MSFYESKKFNLLIVENEPDKIKIYKEQIKSTGLTVNICDVTDGFSAIHTIKNKDFGCILMSYQLSDMNAQFILAKIQDGPNLSTPVIIITPPSLYNIDLELLEAGAIDCVEEDEINKYSLRKAILYALVRKRYQDSKHSFEHENILKQHKREMENAIFKEKKQLNEKNMQLRFMALHDSLTRLPNKELFLEHLAHSLLESTRLSTQLSVLFIDLDHFKNVNDTLGHRVGDLLLISVTKRIKVMLRASDTFARIGGDEFLILIDKIHNVESTKKIAKKVNNELAKPFLIENKKISISASIGITHVINNTLSKEAIIEYADQAMYAAKESGKNTFKVYNNQLKNIRDNEQTIEDILNDDPLFI
ncbi:MAG: hypothetical protein COB83_07530 [Gammaproteobacteria bacterium]|nr:MAG: hypothetical protein COB83_07530 [Gammaproteobacteria bacterium]